MTIPENQGEIDENEIFDLEEIQESDPTDLDTPRGSSNKLKPEEIPFNLEAALIRLIQIFLKIRFFCFRSTYEYRNAFITC